MAGIIKNGTNFWQNSIVRLTGGLALAQNVIAWTILFFGVSREREVIIIHYNVFLGVDAVGSYADLYQIPATGLFFLLVNVFLAQFFYRNQERIAAYILLLAGVMLGFGGIVAAVSLALVNY